MLSWQNYTEFRQEKILLLKGFSTSLPFEYEQLFPRVKIFYCSPYSLRGIRRKLGPCERGCATEQERLLTTARANHSTGLTNGRTANWVPEVEFSPFRAPTRREMTFPFRCKISLLLRQAHAFRVKRSERVFLGYVTKMLCMTKIGLERHRSGIRQMLYFLNKNMTTEELIWTNLTRLQSSLSLFLLSGAMGVKGTRKASERVSLPFPFPSAPAFEARVRRRRLGTSQWKNYKSVCF